jgi:hypothetical protein
MSKPSKHNFQPRTTHATIAGPSVRRNRHISRDGNFEQVRQEAQRAYTGTNRVQNPEQSEADKLNPPTVEDTEKDIDPDTRKTLIEQLQTVLSALRAEEGEDAEEPPARNLKSSDAVTRIVCDIADAMGRLFLTLKACGGIPRIDPTTKRGPVTTHGIRAQDAAKRVADRKLAVTRNRTIRASTDALQAAGYRVNVQTYWDRNVGVYKIV